MGWRSPSRTSAAARVCRSFLLTWGVDQMGAWSERGGIVKAWWREGALDHTADAVIPGPARAIFEDLTAPGVVLPHLVAGGGPVLADHLDRAISAVELDTRHSVLWNREPGSDDGVAGVTKIEHQMSVIVRADLHQLTVDDALGN